MTLEDSWLVSYKPKPNLTIQSSNCIRCFLPKAAENLCPHKNLHMNIYHKFIFLTGKTGTQPRSLSTGKRVNCGSTKKKQATKPWEDMEQP